MWTAVRQFAARLYRDERGAEGFEKLLIIAAVVLPLLGILIFFRDDILTWITGVWQDTTGRSGPPSGS